MGKLITGIYRNITILYEDNHLLVVHKPENMLSQSDITGDEDLQSLLKIYLKEKYQKPGNVFLALVQRLDRPVSGLMVLARTSKAAARLSEQVRNRTMIKEYLAVVESTSVPSGTFTHYLRKDENSKTAQVFSNPTPGALTSVLEVNHIDTRHGYSLVSVRLHTGRFHQIRAQLSFCGMPIAGDVKYGAKPATDNSIALMCQRLEFLHPTVKNTVSYTTHPPDKAPWSFFHSSLTI